MRDDKLGDPLHLPEALLNDTIRLVVYDIEQQKVNTRTLNMLHTLTYSRRRYETNTRTPSTMRTRAKLYRADATMRTFIEDEQLALPNNRTRQCHDLPLADREIGPAGGDARVEREPALVAGGRLGLRLELGETRGSKGAVEGRVVDLIEWVEVLANRAVEEVSLT